MGLNMNNEFDVARPREEGGIVQGSQQERRRQCGLGSRWSGNFRRPSPLRSDPVSATVPNSSGRRTRRPWTGGSETGGNLERWENRKSRQRKPRLMLNASEENKIRE